MALPIMLRGMALTYYFTHLKNLTTISAIQKGLRDYFEGEEYQKKIFTIWNAINLKQFIAQGHSTEKTFQLLIDEMWQLRRGLTDDLRNDMTFYNKLFTACQGVNDCKVACFRPASTLTGLIRDIKSAIATYGRPKQEETYYTDRRYTDRRHQAPSFKKKYFICGQSDYWSTNHPKEERIRKVRQHITAIEGEEIDDDPDQEDPFPYGTDTFITEQGPVNGKELYAELASNATKHALTNKDAVSYFFNFEPIEDKESYPFESFEFEKGEDKD